MAAKSCKKCGGPIPIQRGAHRPRLFCLTCRPPRLRSAPDVTGDVAYVAPPPADVATGRLVEATERKLEAAGRLGEPEGVQVLKLAESIDAGGHSGASLAALSREFSRALAGALAVADGEAAGDGVVWDVG